MYKFLQLIIIIWSISAVAGCSTSTPIPAPTFTAMASLPSASTTVPSATTTASITETPVSSATATFLSKSSPTPYAGPNTLLYIQDDNRLFSIQGDGSNQHEIAQGIQFTVSPDKKKMVYRTAETNASNQDEMVVLDLEQEKIIYRWRIPGYCEGFFMSSRFAWSPDSQRIAFILVRYDLVDPAPDCKLEYNLEDWGIYQIDLTSANITHPSLLDSYFGSWSAGMGLLYSPDGSKIRLDTYSPMFDTETWEPVAQEPHYGALQLCDRPEKVSICDGYNLCIHGQKNDEKARHLTSYQTPGEAITTFKLFSNCSAIAYQTDDRMLHILSLSSEDDISIGTNVWEYFIAPDNSKIVFYEQDRFLEEANVFIISSDGSNKYPIARFPRRNAAINGPLMALSPTGEKVAFVNRDGIAIMDLDGNNFVQLVNLPDGAPTDKISLEILGWH